MALGLLGGLNGPMGGGGGTLGGFTPDPTMQRIQNGFTSGTINSAERAYLDQMASRDQTFAMGLQAGGLTEAESQQVAARRQTYEETIARFETSNPAIDATSPEMAARTRGYDNQLMTSGRNGLAIGAQNGTIDRSEFQSLREYSLQTETMRAGLAEGGFTAAERETIDGRLQSYNQMLERFGQTSGEAPQGSLTRESSELFERVAGPNPGPTNGSSLGFGGIPQPQYNQGTFQLQEEGLRAYGEGVNSRSGEVFPDERAAVRASFREPRPTGVNEVRQPAPVGTEQQGPPRHYENLDAFHSRLQAMDSDGSGTVSRREVTNALRDPSIQGDDARLLASIHAGYDNFTTAQTTAGPLGAGLQILGPGREPMINIGEFTSDQAGTPGYQQRLDNLNNVRNIVDNQAERIAGRPPGLYDETGRPDPGSISQGLTGDCWYLSSVGGMKPETIQNMIHQRDDGQYEVRFPGREPELVAPPTEAERLVLAQSNGDWMQVLEKGADQIMERRGSDIQGDQNTTAYELLTGSGGRHVLTNGSLNTQGYANATVEQDPQALGDQLQQGFAEGRIVNAYSSQGSSDTFMSRLSAGNHAYTVTGYDSESGTVTVRNPWGQNETADRDGQNDGVFQMPLREFQASFPVVVLSEGTPNAGH